MQRYFIDPQQMDAQSCRLVGSDVHHISHVLRLKLGDELICCNGEGRSVLGKIVEMDKELISCQIVEELQRHRELPIQVSIGQGLPKREKLEWILQKGTELGAHRFIPFQAARSIVKYDRKKEEKKADRWKKIVKEAAEQSHRSYLPQIDAVSSFQALLQIEADCKLVAYEGESQQEQPSSFFQALKGMAEGERLLVLVGPEGGWTEQEIALLEQHGYTSISLGARILRTETASQYILSAISFYFEQMGG